MEDLDDILKGKVETAAPAPVPEPVVEAAPVVAETPAEPAEPDLPEGEVAPSGRRVVPLEALQAERTKRNDYKEQFARADEIAKAEKARADDLAARLEALQKAPPPTPAAPPAPPPAPRAVPNPVEDPNGYHAYMQEALQQQRLDVSEQLTRQHLGDEKVNAAFEVFKSAVAKDPTLHQKVMGDRNPWQAMVREADRIKVLDEIGTDPAAYRQRIEAEIRASMAAQTPAPAPVAAPVNLPASLAAVRSAAPRSAPTFTGPESLEQILGR